MNGGDKIIPELEIKPVLKSILTTTKTEQHLANTDTKYPHASLSECQRSNTMSELSIPPHHKSILSPARGKENIPPHHI